MLSVSGNRGNTPMAIPPSFLFIQAGHTKGKLATAMAPQNFFLAACPGIYQEINVDIKWPTKFFAQTLAILIGFRIKKGKEHNAL